MDSTAGRSPPEHASDARSVVARDNEGVRVVSMERCPLCGLSGAVLYSNLRDRYWSAPGLWSIRNCLACEHFWLDPRPVPEDLGKLYASYFTHGIPRENPFEGEAWWPRFRRGVMAAIGYPGIARDGRERVLGQLARLLPPVWEECEELARSLRGPPRGLLLDIGCGDGSYMQTMRTLGWTVRGIEPDPIAAEVARGRGLDVATTALEGAALPSDTFDAITMSHVIEHLVEPQHALEAVRRSLKPGGTILIITPNARSWGHSQFGGSWYHLDPPRHLHLFTIRSLVACAARAGLSTVGVRTTGRGHLVYDASRSIRRRGRFRLDDPSFRATTGDRWFRLVEQGLLRIRRGIGEEILMFCEKEPTG